MPDNQEQFEVDELTPEGVEPLGEVEEIEGPKRKRKEPKIFKWIGLPNLAEEFSTDYLNELGREVIKGWESDRGSRGAREDQMSKAMDIALQTIEAKNYPWPGAANVKFPLLTMASIQFGAQIYPAIMQNGNIVKGKIIGKDEIMEPVIDPNTGEPAIDPQTGQPVPPQEVKLGKQEKADRIAEFMNWQLNQEIDNWEEDVDRMCHILPIVGCVFKKTYYDPLNDRPVSQMIFPNDLYVQYDTRGLEKCRRITHTFEMSRNDIVERQRSSLFSEGVDLESGDGGLIKLSVEEYSQRSKEDGYEVDSNMFLVLEQHRWIDLDEDGYEEPYVVTVLEATGEVLRIVPRYIRADVMYNKKGEVIKIDAQQYFTKYSFLPSPDGSFYDIGFGDILYPINESINTSLNLLLDAGHIANTKGGLIGGDLRLKSGNMRFKPGEWKVVNTFGNDIRSNIVQLDHGEPSAVLFQLLNLLIDTGREIASIKDVLSGQLPINAPATTTIAIIERGLTVFKAIYKRMHRSLKQELKKIYRINYMFLDEAKYQEVLDDPQATLQDFAFKHVDIIPVSDPAQISDMQKMARAQVLRDFFGDPDFDQIDLKKRYLRMTGIQDYDELFAPPPPPPGPNPMADAQLAQTVAQTKWVDTQAADIQAKRTQEGLKLENDRYKTLNTIQVSEVRADAEASQKVASAVLDMARAEKEEVGLQNDIYIDQVKQARAEISPPPPKVQPEIIQPAIGEIENVRRNNQGTVGGVETPPDNEGVQPVPPGL